MPKSKASNTNIAKPESVADQILNKFYDALEKHPDLKDIATRFRTETSRSEGAVRKILFGESND